VDGVEVVADLLRCLPHLDGLRLSSRPILVGAADVERLISPQTAKAREDVGIGVNKEERANAQRR